MRNVTFIFSLCLLGLFSCSKDESAKNPCLNGKVAIFKIKCDNCSTSKPLNVKIFGDNTGTLGSAILASNQVQEISVNGFIGSYFLKTQTCTSCSLIKQKSGSLTFNGCEAVVNATVFY